MRAALVAAALCGCAPAGPAMAEYHGRAMGSPLDIEVTGPDRATCERAVEAARAEIERLERMMTDWKDDSPLMEINHQAGRRPVSVPPELFLIIRKSIELSELTEGAFDISFAAAGTLWNWKDPRVPSDAEVRASLADVGWRGIVIDEANQTVFLAKPGMRIGLGAIAPGYAGDRALEKIAAQGIRDAMVNVSGDVVVRGAKNGGPWKVAVRHPRRPGESLAILPVSNGAISTSGDYERYFEADGRRYCHIIDPRSGIPANRCQSVTVLAPVLAVADGLATGIFVLGPEKGLALVEQLAGVEALIVAADGSVHLSRGLKEPGR